MIASKYDDPESKDCTPPPTTGLEKQAAATAVVDEDGTDNTLLQPDLSGTSHANMDSTIPVSSPHPAHVLLAEPPEEEDSPLEHSKQYLVWWRKNLQPPVKLSPAEESLLLGITVDTNVE